MQDNRVIFEFHGKLNKSHFRLNASQMGLNITGHNLTNVNTPGFTRQQALQNDSFYMNIGRNGKDILSVVALVLI